MGQVITVLRSVFFYDVCVNFFIKFSAEEPLALNAPFKVRACKYTWVLRGRLPIGIAHVIIDYHIVVFEGSSW